MTMNHVTFISRSLTAVQLIPVIQRPTRINMSNYQFCLFNLQLVWHGTHSFHTLMKWLKFSQCLSFDCSFRQENLLTSSSLYTQVFSWTYKHSTNMANVVYLLVLAASACIILYLLATSAPALDASIVAKSLDIDYDEAQKFVDSVPKGVSINWYWQSSFLAVFIEWIYWHNAHSLNDIEQRDFQSTT